MNSDQVLQEFQRTYFDLADFYQRCTTPLELNSELILETFEEFAVSLEELCVAQEVLLQQNHELERTRTQVEVERQRYQNLFELAPDGYLVTDGAGIIEQANRAAAEILNVPHMYLIGKPLTIFIPDSERMNFRFRLNQLVVGKKLPEWELRLIPRHGKPIDAAITVSNLHSEDGEKTWLWLVRNITERKQAESANQVLRQELWQQQQLESVLRQNEAYFRSLFENSPVAYQLLDKQGFYLDVNSELCNLLGYTREELLGKSFGEFWTPQTKPYFAQQFTDGQNTEMTRLELQLLTKDNAQLTVLLECRSQYDENDRFVRRHCILYNITERKSMEESLRQAQIELGRINRELKHLVNVDSLTQIANRRCFDSVLAKEWQRLQREQKPLSLILFDVDYFKRYNDYYGHQKGDQCLFKIAQTVNNAVYRPADLVARYGGEEFAVILPNINREGAIEVANRIQMILLSLGIPHADSPVSKWVTVSFGIASLIPCLDQSSEILIAQADHALYHAKEQGRDQYAIAT